MLSLGLYNMEIKIWVIEKENGTCLLSHSVHSEGLRHISVRVCLCVMVRLVGWIIEVYSWVSLACWCFFTYLSFLCVCVCPPICVGLAGGQSDGELESWMWHYIPASYHSDIWPNRTQRGWDCSDKKQRMKIGRKQRNVKKERRREGRKGKKDE